MRTMAGTTVDSAKEEIDESLKLSSFCMRCLGLTFEKNKSSWKRFRQTVIYTICISGMCYHVFSEIIFISITFTRSPSVEEVVPLLHTFGYGILSTAKCFALSYKLNVFGELLEELSEIWPMPPLDEDAQSIKDKSLTALRIAHRWYFGLNMSGVWFYILTPIAIYVYELWQGLDTVVGFVWKCWYPFNKHHPVTHVLVYIVESMTGQVCVWIMISTDLLFSGMASHISLLLRILQRRLESIGTAQKTEDEQYQEICANIKLHQQLIRFVRDENEIKYCLNLGDAFSLSNLINIVLSSINICCVVFIIVLLEPMMAVSNKLFLGSALIQIGMLCWYADDIFHANADIATAAYNSCWYQTSPRCRRALLFLIRRSQKPIAFTAMNFTNISLVTYSSILTRSYSYFALLYTMYSEN